MNQDLRRNFRMGGGKRTDESFANRTERSRIKQQLHVGAYEDDDEVTIQRQSNRKRHSKAAWGGVRGFKSGLIGKWLERQVGRLWDNIYSDLSRMDSSRLGNYWSNTSIREAACRKVEFNAFLEDGKIMAIDWRGEPRPIEEAWEKMYVHPTTGRLVKRKDRARGPRWSFHRRRKPDYLEGAKGVRYYLIDGSWYEFLFQEIEFPADSRTNSHLYFHDPINLHEIDSNVLNRIRVRSHPLRGFTYYDVLIGYRTSLTRQELINKYYAPIVPYSKRQVSGKEIKRLKLNELWEELNAQPH